jgi:hypothetical protein
VAPNASERAIKSLTDLIVERHVSIIRPDSGLQAPGYRLRALRAPIVRLLPPPMRGP